LRQRLQGGIVNTLESSLRRGMLAAAVALVALTFASVALAGNGGGTKGTGGNAGSSTLTLAMVTDLNANGLPNWGDTVTFKVSTTATTEPHVDLTCTQNGTVVYSATTGFFAGYPWPWTQNMTLSSQKWTGGSAACSARLYYFSGSKTVTVSTLSFTAGA
jgi:hypothetical protein